MGRGKHANILSVRVCVDMVHADPAVAVRRLARSSNEQALA